MYPPLFARLIDIQGNTGFVKLGSGVHSVNLHLLESPTVGEYIVAQLGFAVQSLGLNKPSRKTVGRKKNSYLRSEIEHPTGGRVFCILVVSGVHMAHLGLPNVRCQLPHNLRFCYGAGCALCITPDGFYRTIAELATQKGTIVVSTAEVLHMSLYGGSIETSRLTGLGIRRVYNPMDALRISQLNGRKDVILVSIGFDAMAATVAATIVEADHRNLQNFFLYSSLHRQATLIEKHTVSLRDELDSVLVSPYELLIWGVEPLKKLSTDLGKPVMISGYEVGGILDCIHQALVRGPHERTGIHYDSSDVNMVKGNSKAQEFIMRVFQMNQRESMSSSSTYCLRGTFESFDVRTKFEIPVQSMEFGSLCTAERMTDGAKSLYQCPGWADYRIPEQCAGPLVG